MPEPTPQTPEETHKIRRLERILSNIDGQGILMLRANQNLSQENIARELGVSVKTFWRWEKGKSKMSSLARQKVAELYGDFILSIPFYQKYL